MSVRADTIDKMLENQVENDLGDEEIKTKEDVREQTEGREFPEAMKVFTSGSGSEPLPVPYHHDILDDQIETVADLLSFAGVTEEDYVLNACGPLPHISGWDAIKGSERLGAELASNDSYEDWHEIVGTDEAEEVTALITMPAIAQKMAGEIRESEGVPISEVFPNMEKGIFGGDFLMDDEQEDLVEEFEFDVVNQVYASSELNYMAASSDGSRWMMPKIDDYVFEILPLSEADSMDQGELVDIRNAPDGMRGYVVITDPDRKAVDMTRYFHGDVVEVNQSMDAPHIRLEGRDNSINFQGALVEESILNRAVQEAYQGDREVQWIADERNEDIYVSDRGNWDEDYFRAHLYQTVPSTQEAENHTPLELQFYPLSEYEGAKGMKTQRIVNRKG